MTTRLTIIDQETRAELAELGMAVEVERRPVVLCRDCRFIERHDHRSDQCIITGNTPIEVCNPRGECERFELASRTITIAHATAIVSALVVVCAALLAWLVTP